MSEIYTSDYIAGLIGGVPTKKNVQVSNFSSLSNADENSITFYNDAKFKNDLLNTQAGIVILKKTDLEFRQGVSIIVDDPYLSFAKVSSLFNKQEFYANIHDKSYVSASAKLGENILIGPFTSIGNATKVEDNVSIGASTSIGDNVFIGSNTRIHSNVTIESNVRIGKNCEVYSGARIGTSGFGYARDKDGSWINIPQVGSVIIGNYVDIGANSTIDRGAIENTIINNGVKIDNLVQIGHNCVIGENTIIAGCAGIAGSATIGKNCMIGGAAMIKGHIKIADNTIISGGTGIGKNVENPDKRFTNVFPYNIEHKQWLRIANYLKKIGKKND